MISFKLSLRSRLIAAAVLVEVAVIGLLMVATLRTADHGLVAQTKQRVAELNVLLNAALAAPLAQRDYATLHEILGEASLGKGKGLSYLVLSDQGGKVVASVGWPDGRALPTPSADVDEAELADGKVDLALPIRLAGQHYGNLAFGVATPVLLETRANLLRQGGTVTLVALVLTVLVLALVGYWLTRQLVVLAKASERVAKGDFEIDLPIKSEDELGQLTRAFNAMAMAVRERLGALAESQARFHAIADFTYDMEWWLSPQGQLLWINPSVTRMLGYTPDECLAMANFPLPLVAPADWDLVRRELALGLVGLSGIISTLIAVLLTRSITRPIRALARIAAAMTAGNLAVRVPPMGVDEIGTLARTMEQMAAGLEQVAQLPDSVGQVSERVRRPSGIEVARMRVPVGVMMTGVVPLKSTPMIISRTVIVGVIASPSESFASITMR
mgnify:CR=1 FL=1